jgi:hypothetical protein
MVFDETVVDVEIDRMHSQQMLLQRHYFVQELLVQLLQSPEFDLNYYYYYSDSDLIIVDVHMLLLDDHAFEESMVEFVMDDNNDLKTKINLSFAFFLKRIFTDDDVVAGFLV